MSNVPPMPMGLTIPTKKVSATGRPGSFAIIGRDKAGKTQFGASCYDIPQLRRLGLNVLIIEAESGTASISEFYPDVDLVSVSSFLDFQDPITGEWKVGLKTVLEQLKTRPHNYGAVVFDTYDKLQSYVVQYYLAVSGTDTYGAYREIRRWTLDTAWDFHKGPIFTIFLFHEEIEKDNTGNWRTQYKLAGSAGDEIGEVFDLIGHLAVEEATVGEPHRVLQLGPGKGLPTGNRWETKLPAKMEDATVKQIFDIIYPDTIRTTN